MHHIYGRKSIRNQDYLKQGF